jgi:large subunit ribosomal protein L13
MCTEAARVLRGKHKPIFAPHIDTGDHVVVINASKVVLTKDKAANKGVYRYSGYPGGMKTESYEKLLGRKPEEAIRRSIAGMLPKGPLGRQMIKKLKVYAGPEHPHAAQLPVALELDAAEGPLSAKGTSSMATKPLTQTTGRRKEGRCSRSTAPRQPVCTRSRKAFDAYFTTAMQRMTVTEALRVTETETSYDIDATMHGGGISGQAAHCAWRSHARSSSSIPRRVPR